MALDEVTQICPVPLPHWLADSGGQGVIVWSAYHGVAQLRARWKADGAQTVLDTSNVLVILPGLKDDATLQQASDLCGTVSFRRRGASETYDMFPVITRDMIRQLPAGWALIIRNNLSPVVVRLARGWEYRPQRRLARRGKAAAEITPPPVIAAVASAPAVPAAPAPPKGTLVLAPAPPPEAVQASGNGTNGSSAAHYPWSPQ
jgi:hypothetical protein